MMKMKSTFWWESIVKHPFVVFVVAMCLLIGLIVGSKWWHQEEADPEVVAAGVTQVEVFDPSEVYLVTTAKVDNQGIIKVVVQNPSGGVVQKVNVQAGQKVRQGQQLVSLSTNYQGGNTSALALQMAEKNWLMTHANYWDQQKLDDINYELDQNTAWVGQTETNPSRGLMGNGDAYTQYQSQQTAEMIDVQVGMADRAQQLALDSSESNYFSAQIAASLMYPAAPVAGVVERVSVTKGNVVGAGVEVAVIKANEARVQLNLSVGENVVRYLNLEAPVYFELDGQSYEASFDYLSSVPVNGLSRELILSPSDEGEKLNLTHGDYVSVRLPLIAKGGTLIPLVSVYQTQNESYAYVVDAGASGRVNVRQQAVKLGAVVGEYVIVAEGLESGMRAVLANNLLDGEVVEIVAKN